MADVVNVSLAVADRPDGRGRWSVAVEYSLVFEEWEREAWFREEIAVVGMTADGERELATLTGPAFKAAQVLGADAELPARRRPPTIPLDARTLDVAPDGVAIVDLDSIVVEIDLHRPDHLFASVAVVPLLPTTGQGRSSLSHRHLGGVRA